MAAPTYELSTYKFNPLISLKDGSSRPKHIVAKGGRATGKSVSAALATIIHCRSPKLIKAGRGLRVVIARQFGSSIDQSFWEELKNAACMMGVEDEFIWGAKKITHRITKSTITSIGLERNKGNIKGLAQVDLLIVEEANFVSQESIDILIPTIRKPHSVILWLYNPTNRTDAVAKTFVECETPYPGCLIIDTNWRDNKFFSERSEADRVAMETNDPIRYLNVYEGEYLGADDYALINPILIKEAIGRKVIRDESLAIVAGLDVAGLGKDWTVLVRRRGNEILSRHKLATCDDKQLTEWVMGIYADHPFDKLVVDASGNTGPHGRLAEIAESLDKFSVHKFMGGKSARRPELYTNLRTETWVKMRDWLKTGQLDNDAEWYAICSLKYTWAAKDQIKLDAKKTLKKSPDAADALSMTFFVSDQKPAPVIGHAHSTGTWQG